MALCSNGGSSSSAVGFLLGIDDREAIVRNGNYALITSGSGYVCVNRSENKLYTGTIRLVFSLFDADASTEANRFLSGVNGAAVYGVNTSSNAPVEDDSSYDFAIGVDPRGGSALTGIISELILYPSDQSTNRTGIESNINNHFEVY